MQDASERLAVALDLHRAGVDLMRQNLRRRHPDADPETIDALLRDWLQDRPGARHGDGPAPTSVAS